MADAEFDLVVIGSGPAGEKGAAQAAYFGKKVAIVERNAHPGGAAANTGTLPSKTLRETALYMSGFKQRGLYGVDLNYKKDVSARDFLFRERLVRDAEVSRIVSNLERHQIERYTGTASFVDPHTITVADGNSTHTLRGEVILLATGSRPFRPPGFDFCHPAICDSDDILELEKMPKRMAVLGAGVIGTEYACTFGALNVEVTLINSQEILLPFLDGEISRALRAGMECMGIRMRMPGRLLSVEPGDPLRLTLESGEILETDLLLVAAGRSSNVEPLKLDVAGVDTGARGLILVNEFYQTNVPHIYAAGDVIGFPSLASTSMEQARVAIVHAFNLKYKSAVAPILPYGIYSIPECSMAGETEESLQKKNIEYVAGRARYQSNARGTIIGDEHGLLKLLFEKSSRKLLGVHVVGEQATELVHIGLVALLSDATSELFIRTCFNYPTLGELYKYATYDALGKM